MSDDAVCLKCRHCRDTRCWLWRVIEWVTRRPDPVWFHCAHPSNNSGPVVLPVTGQVRSDGDLAFCRGCNLLGKCGFFEPLAT